MRDGAHVVFFQLQGIFHYFRPLETEILQIYLLIEQILNNYINPPKCQWPAMDIYLAANIQR